MKRIAIHRVRQKKGYCGPASLEMMFSSHGLSVSQDTIVDAAGLSETIRDEGTRVDQLSEAVQRLHPSYTLLAKYNAGIRDLATLVEEFGLPVGVEWQGMFIDSKGRRFEEGHYSVVVGVEWEAGHIYLVDPDENSALAEGKIPIGLFEERWWEENDVPLPNNPDQTEIIRNDHLLFVLVPKERVKPLLDLGLHPASLSLMRACRTPRQTT